MIFKRDKICPKCGAVMKAGSTPTHENGRFRIHYLYCKVEIAGVRCEGRRTIPEPLVDNISPDSLQNCKLE